MRALLVIVRKVHAHEADTVLERRQADSVRLIFNVVFNLHETKYLR